MKGKTSFVGARIEPDLKRKLHLISMAAGEPGNESAAVRWAIQNVPVASDYAELAEAPTGSRPERALVAA